MAYNPWTGPQESYLSKYWGKILAEDLSPVMGRSPNALRLKASKMGLKSELPHAPERKIYEAWRVKAYIDLGMHAREIARMLGTDRKNVYNLVKNRKDIDDEYYIKLLRNTQTAKDKKKDDTRQISKK